MVQSLRMQLVPITGLVNVIVYLAQGVLMTKHFTQQSALHYVEQESPEVAL